MDGTSLSTRFASLRRRLTAIGGAAGFGWGVTAAIVAIAAAVWLDLIWELPPAMRAATWGVAAVAAAALPLLFLARAWRRADDARLADRFDVAGRTAGSVRAGWELSQTKSFALPLSAGLAKIAVARAEHDAAGVPTAAVAPLGSARPALLGAAGTTLAVAFFGLIAPQLALTEWHRFSRPFDDVAPYSPITIHVEPGDAKVVYGAGLDVRVRTEGPPVRRIELVLQADGGAEEALPMFPDSGGEHRTTLTSITAPATYYVRADSARSRRFRLEVITVPRLEKLRVRIAPPEYTRTKPYEGPLPADGIVGLKDTEVTFFATSNRPLSGGTLSIVGDVKAAPTRETITLQPLTTGDVTVSGSFRIAASGKFELRVTDVAGESSTDSYSGAIDIAEDQRPFVRILQPREQSLAVPDATIPVEWSAEDDYGVSGLTLYRSLNDSAWLPLDLAASSPPEKRAIGAVALPLASYGLEPGDEIKLFVRVEDNDPLGAKGSESGVCRIRIISQEEFERMVRMRHTLEMLASKYRQVQRRLETLKEKKEGLKKKMKEKPQDQEIGEEERQALAAMQKQLEEDLAALRKVAKSKLPYDLDQSLEKQLERHIERMQKAADGLKQLTRNEKLKNSELAAAMEALSKELDEADLDVEQKMMEPIEHLELIFPLIADQAKFVELVRRQRELAERIAALKGNDGRDDPRTKARLRDLEAEQADLRGALDDLLAEIESHAERLPDDEKLEKLKTSAKEFVAAVRETRAMDDMSEAEAALSGFLAAKAADEAKEAADKLESLLSKCQGMGGEGSMCLKFSPGLAQGLGNTIAQLLGQMGFGSGTGSGGGYSASRSGLDNMGLYGDLPTMQGNDGGGLNDRPRNEAAGPGFARSGPPGKENTVKATGAAAGEATGRFEAPPVYRRRVADYFRRLAEDLEE